MNEIKQATKLAKAITPTRDWFTPIAKMGIIDGHIITVTRKPSPFAKAAKEAQGTTTRSIAAKEETMLGGTRND